MQTEQLPRLEAGEYPGGIWYSEPHPYLPYRYVLGRVGRHPLVCIGINPSTAQPGALDPTLKSVERLANANGFDSWIMFNVYPQRATDPNDMDRVPDRALCDETLRWLREAHTAGHLNFIGNIEAKEAIKGGCDVIVCDGFSGNVLLKTMEGVGSFAGSALKAMFKKNLLTKLHCEGTKTVFIEAAGPCEVTAGDIKPDGEVEVLNPELHIATLDVGATLSMEITLSHGRGYVSADRNKALRAGVIGVIPIDSIYTPVYKVNYTVENTRVGNLSDFDKLTLEVWTDSTITARDAVSLGAKILCDHFALFTDLSDTMGDKSTVVEKAESQTSKIMEMTIDDMDLSVRSFNCLKRANINTVEDLISKTEDEMMKVRNLGRKSLEEVINKLAMMGLSLADEENN